MKKLVVFISIFILAAALSGCDDEKAAETTTSNVETPAASQPQEDAMPVATEMVMEPPVAKVAVPDAPADPQAALCADLMQS